MLTRKRTPKSGAGRPDLSDRHRYRIGGGKTCTHKQVKESMLSVFKRLVESSEKEAVLQMHVISVKQGVRQFPRAAEELKRTHPKLYESVMGIIEEMESRK